MNRIGILIGLALLTAIGAVATTTYSQSVSAVTSVTITGGTHGLGCSTFGVRVYDNNGSRRNDLVSGWSISGFNYDVTVNFSTSFTGTVKLQGCYSYTSASTDFQVTISGDSQTVYFCAACTDSEPAVQNLTDNTLRAFNFAALGQATVTYASQSGTLYVWLDPATGFVGFGTTTSVGVNSPAGDGATLVHNISGYPSGVKPIARVGYVPWGFTSVTDDR